MLRAAAAMSRSGWVIPRARIRARNSAMEAAMAPAARNCHHTDRTKCTPDGHIHVEDRHRDGEHDDRAKLGADAGEPVERPHGHQWMAAAGTRSGPCSLKQ